MLAVTMQFQGVGEELLPAASVPSCVETLKERCGTAAPGCVSSPTPPNSAVIMDVVVVSKSQTFPARLYKRPRKKTEKHA
jgi:hypothetical protein